MGIEQWLALDRDLGEWYGRSIKRMLASGRPRRETPHAIACHGQTVAHFPAHGLTLQLGNPSRIARWTGLTVVSSFREGDLAARGQGAPLVPVFHRLLAASLAPGRTGGRGLSIHNVGGVSNLTYIDRKGGVLAFDTGPGNFWIDEAARMATRGLARMDRDGRLARSGRADAKAVAGILRHPYFRAAAPKSTGRDQFPFELLRDATRARGADLVATATAITVESMALAYERFILAAGHPLRAVHLCGGGARNPMVVEGLRARLPGARVAPIDESGFDGQLIEAQAFAYCGYLALCGKPLGGPWTGAEGYGPPAHVIPGENWAEARSRLPGNRSRN